MFAARLPASLLLYLLARRRAGHPRRRHARAAHRRRSRRVSPDDVVSYVSGARTPTVRAIVDNAAQGQGRRAHQGGAAEADRLRDAVLGKVQEIRDAVLDFKKSGKPVYAYLEYGGDRDYYLASAADKVFLMPSSPLDLTGVATYELFLRGTLDKVGAYPDLHHIGDYKTAVNTFTEKGFTRGAPRDGRVAQPRSLRADRPRHRRRPEEDRGRRPRADRRGPFLPEDALRAGPHRRCRVRGSGRATSCDGSGGGDSAAIIDGDDYARVSRASLGLNRGPRIAVIYAAGAIVSGESGFDPVNGAGRRLRHAHRAHPRGAARPLGPRDRAAHRQPRRIRDGLRRDLARADDRRDERADRSDRRVDVRPGGVGRLLHRACRPTSSSPSRPR